MENGHISWTVIPLYRILNLFLFEMQNSITSFDKCQHGGIAANGHCVAFPQEIDKPAKILPNLPSEINIIKVRKQGQNDTFKDFNVSRY